MDQPYSPRRQSFGYLNAPTRSRSFDDDPEDEMYPPRELKSPRSQTDLFVSINMLATALVMLLLTTIPVVVSIPDISIWFSGDALWRLFDPVITLPLNLSIMLQAEVFQTGGKPRFLGVWSERTFAMILWAIGAGIYVQVQLQSNFARLQ
ncbi:hypothetical protein BC943DRAFT_163260 [Umbelopsis sp. AD052]|nr:hypothetical protein BC943DRAFT_163260 [Umbelopsis sp. AD052]